MALLLALRKDDDPSLAVSIEKIDDITFENNGTAYQRLQTKHQVVPGSVTDASADVWKTIRIWSEEIASSKLVPDKTLLFLLTTGSAKAESALAYLRGDGERQPQTARSMLESTAEQSDSKVIKKAFATYSRLTQSQRTSLFEAIHVLDRSPTAVEVRPLLIRELRLSAEQQHRNALADRLEGWWLEQVISHLTSPANIPIPVERILAQVVEISRQFHRDCLPDDFLTVDVPPEDCPANDVRRFVRQLELIGIKTDRIRAAQEDFYRAVAQRSRWVKDSLIDLPELAAFETRLHVAWKAMFDLMVEALSDCRLEDEQRKQGWNLYNWAQTQAPANCGLWVRPQFQASYMTTGSFHILADKDPPRIGWHPDHTNRLSTNTPQGS